MVIPPSTFRAKTLETFSSVASGPTMPLFIGMQPVALAAHAISNIVLVPSTYEAT